ncbi:uncharacterized protein LOC134534270 [Bacillus rossius redtenbacheri]|uniref:uncharacterized protein LOC134534270 n=1 Tax=Bacillus rossius redtenbacheri TaxID=93214 RepID=UPI002FDDAD17
MPAAEVLRRLLPWLLLCGLALPALGDEDGGRPKKAMSKEARQKRQRMYEQFIAGMDTCQGEMTFEDLMKCKPTESDVAALGRVSEDCKCLGQCLMQYVKLIDERGLVIRDKFVELTMLHSPETTPEELDAMLVAVRECEEKPTAASGCGRPVEVTQCVLEATGRSVSLIDESDLMFDDEDSAYD